MSTTVSEDVLFDPALAERREPEPVQRASSVLAAKLYGRLVGKLAHVPLGLADELAAVCDEHFGHTDDPLERTYVRRGAGERSKEAEALAAGHCAAAGFRVLERIAASPCTDEKGAAEIGMNPNTWRPRRRALAEAGWIAKTGDQAQTVGGALADVWHLTGHGIEQLVRLQWEAREKAEASA